MRRLAGFSLMEVLVTFIILTSAVAIFWPAMVQPVKTTAVQVDRALAEDFARSRLARIGTVQPPATGQASGRDGTFVWRERIAQVILPSSSERIFRVEIEVFGPQGRTRLARVESFR